MKFYRSVIFLAGLLLLVSGRCVIGDDLIGTKALLKQVEEEAVNLMTPEEENRWTSKIHGLAAELETMEPVEAAATWIRVYFEWHDDEERAAAGTNLISARSFINSLPNPTAWPELVAQLERRPIVGDEPAQLHGLALRMMAHRLLGQTDRVKEDVDQALKLVGTKKKSAQGGLWRFLGSLFGANNPAQLQRAALREQLYSVLADVVPAYSVERFRERVEGPESELQGSLSVPDIVGIAGREQAVPLLEKALLLKQTQLTFETRAGNNQTIILAREIAKKHLSEISQPCWELCRSTDSVELFDTFTSIEIRPQWQVIVGPRYEASWYLAGLILQEKTNDILKFVEGMQNSNETFTLNTMSIIAMVEVHLLAADKQRGRAPELQRYLANLLSDHPELPFWDSYLSISEKMGLSKSVLSTANKILDRTDLTQSTRHKLELIRADGMLASDRVNEAVTAYLTLLEDPTPAAENESSPEQSRQKLALRVATIGRLLNRQEWIDKGVDTAENILASEPHVQESVEVVDNHREIDPTSFVSLLIELKQFSRAERLLSLVLSRQVAKTLDQVQEARKYQSGIAPTEHEGANRTLELLLQVYHAAGRSADVLALLEEAPWWTKKDVADWFPDHDDDPESSKLPIPFIVAKALSKVDRQEEARQIVEAMVLLWPGFDLGWELALELMGDDFEELAQRTATRNRFEERPLIWEAKFQLSRGRVKQAEELARKAIAIDPSNCHKSRNDRTLAYELLAEVLRKKDENNSADKVDTTIKSIRLAEQADQLFATGLKARAIKLYEASLQDFGSVYYTEARLAVSLSKLGEMASANQHRLQAFALMPDNIGRSGIQCDDCKNLLNGTEEDVATRFFTKLCSEQPTNATTHYLLGVSQSARNQTKQAIESFRQAVKLDPDFLDAWLKLMCVIDLDNHPSSAEIRQEVTLQLLRLDPLSQHAKVDLTNVRDMRRLWTTLKENDSQVPEVTATNLFSLRTARTRITAEQLANLDTLETAGLSDDTMTHNHRINFSSHPELQSIIKLLRGDVTTESATVVKEAVDFAF